MTNISVVKSYQKETGSMKSDNADLCLAYIGFFWKVRYFPTFLLLTCLRLGHSGRSSYCLAEPGPEKVHTNPCSEKRNLRSKMCHLVWNIWRGPDSVVMGIKKGKTRTMTRFPSWACGEKVLDVELLGLWGLQLTLDYCWSDTNGWGRASWRKGGLNETYQEGISNQ